MATRKKLLIVDFMAMVYRSFFAFGRTPLSTKDGRPTAAVYGSALFIHKLIEEQMPDYCIFVRDPEGPTFRHEIFKEYKANRDKMPDDLRVQVPMVETLVQTMGLPILSRERYEADDVIGSLARSGWDVDTYIVSGDKDFLQLVNDSTYVLVPKKGEKTLLMGEKEVMDRFHCPPERVIDCLALMGDSADNVPGVPGIGEKGASKLIGDYGSLEELYQQIDSIKAQKQREKLIENRELAFLSKQLVTIKTDLDLDIDLEQCAISEEKLFENRELSKLYHELEFKQLAAKMVVDGADEESSKVKRRCTYLAIDSNSKAEDLRALLKRRRQAAVYFDLENGILEGVSLSVQSAIAFYIPADEMAILDDFFANEESTIYTFGYRQFANALIEYGIEFAGKVVDVMVMDYLLEPNHYRGDFAFRAERVLGLTPCLETSRGKALERADYCLALFNEQRPKIDAWGMGHLYDEIEAPLAPVIDRMERTGIYIDASILNTLSDKLDSALKELESEIYSLAGEKFNIQSPKQLQAVLFDKLDVPGAVGVRTIKRTKTGYSTDESVLQKLSAHPIASLILKHREYAKLKSTYVDTLPQYIKTDTGRLHTRFHQTGTGTGRLSSDKPNLQNIPLRGEFGKQIRAAFKPEDRDHVLISADYSQVEIRLLAALAEADDLIEAFKNGLDVHQVTAAKIFNVSLEQVKPEMRNQAKAINFGILYGMGPSRLSRETGVSVGEAKAFIERYFETYPKVRAYTLSLIDKARREGYSTTIMGRRRPIPNMDDSNQMLRNRAENMAVNSPIQGSAADLIKLAMIRIDRKIRSRGLSLKMLLQVHDELLFSCPRTELAEAKTVITEGMEGALELRVPLKISLGIGSNWLEAH